MNEAMDVFLGFDPGGEEHFGWSICCYDRETNRFEVLDSGVANSAREVLEAVMRSLLYIGLPNESCRAAGIDAPLFYNRAGDDRIIDQIIRAELIHQGHNWATVISVNALRGACLQQGVLLADLLHGEFEIPITEAHPTALSRLDEHMVDLIDGLPDDNHPHERDATFAAYAAWRMHERADGWNDLLPGEPDTFFPLRGPVSYWMPIL